jgi:DNA-binding MarR family transcriptional regulator
LPELGGRRFWHPHPLATPWLLRRVNQRYRAHMAVALRDAGMGDLPQPGYWALGAIKSGAADASDLVEIMGISKQGVSKLVDTLVGADYVVRQENPTDRRRTNLVLSARGSAAVTTINAAMTRTDQDFATEIGAKNLETLRAILATLSSPE